MYIFIDVVGIIPGIPSTLLLEISSPLLSMILDTSVYDIPSRIDSYSDFVTVAGGLISSHPAMIGVQKIVDKAIIV